MKKNNFKNRVSKMMISAGVLLAGSTMTLAQSDVDLTKFESQCFEDHVVVEWEVAFESNVEYYKLQRSHDGIVWENLQMVEEQVGETDLFYEFTDEDPYGASGMAYYRINAVSYEGIVTLLEIDKTSCEAGEDNPPIVIVSPNPTTGPIVIDKPIGGTIDNYTVTNRMGQVIQKGELRPHRNIIDLDGCDEGMYMIFIGDSKRPVRIWKK